MRHTVGAARCRYSWTSARWRSIVTGWCGSDAVRVGSGRLFLLGLVTNEVDLGFTGLGWGWCWYNDVRLFIGSLNQDIDKSLFFVLWLKRNYGRRRCRGRWGLDEDDLVVLLGWRERDWSANGKENSKCYSFFYAYL